jgi:hypothetical protein
VSELNLKKTLKSSVGSLTPESDSAINLIKTVSTRDMVSVYFSQQDPKKQFHLHS